MSDYFMRWREARDLLRGCQEVLANIEADINSALYRTVELDSEETAEALRRTAAAREADLQCALGRVEAARELLRDQGHVHHGDEAAARLAGESWWEERVWLCEPCRAAMRGDA